MKRYNLLIVLLLLIFNVSNAQKNAPAADFGAIKEAKIKIENTVPLVIGHLEKISQSEGDNTVLNNGKAALEKEYKILASELELYKGNMAGCIINTPKKASKCMNYHTQYFRNTLINYDNYITYLTKKNRFLGVEDTTIQKDFKPTELATNIDKAYSAAMGTVKKLKGNNKTSYFDQLKSDEYKLRSFSEVSSAN